MGSLVVLCILGSYIRIRFGRMTFADTSCRESSVAKGVVTSISFVHLSNAQNHIL